MGDTWPETAEQLMRSRFTAYVLKQPDWLKASAHSSCPALQGTWRDGVQATTFEVRRTLTGHTLPCGAFCDAAAAAAAALESARLVAELTQWLRSNYLHAAS